MFTDHNLHVFLSNQVETLYKQLKHHLFSSSNAFTKRLIIIPSPAMKGWLAQKLVDDLGIAAGIQFVFLDQGISWLQRHLECGAEDSFQLPGQMELALMIESEVRLILKEPLRDLWKPLRGYLIDENKGLLTAKGEKRLACLADQLAGLFHQYEKYGKKMLACWLKETENEWQQALWQRVVGAVGPSVLDWKKGNVSVHLFALSCISRQQHFWLHQLAQKVPVYYHLLSPCEVFWSDLLSDKENRKLIRCWEEQGMSNESLIEATELLFERNPLLANWGRLGRLMAAQVEETVVEIDGEYQEYCPEMCCLHALQMDLLKLRNGKTLEKREFDRDDSIQIHVSNSKMREVQALYQALLHLIDKYSKTDDAIEPRDILVMAPNIKAYEPIIYAVFQSGESLLNCRVMDLTLLDQNDVIQGFLHLIRLADSRWDVDTLLTLFSFRSFQRKYSLNTADIEKITQWVKDADIRWGIHAEHRSEMLIKSHCKKGMTDQSPIGTWEWGIERLLLGTAMILPSSSEEKTAFSRRPCKEISGVDQELLGVLASLIPQLKNDLKPIDEGNYKTLSGWAEYLLSLLHRYFSWSEQSDEEQDQVLSLIHEIESLKKIRSVEKEVFSFSTIIYHLKKRLEDKQLNYRESHLQSVRFCSMLPMRAVPAKIVVMMGLAEDNYPRKESRSALNQLYLQQGADPFPTSADFDRYLFLEAILSARKKLILSYSSQQMEEKTLAGCSLLVSELMTYLDESFTISGMLPSSVCVYRHPFYPFDQRYFQKESALRSYSLYDYRAACSFYQCKEKTPHRFSGLTPFKEGEKNSVYVVDLKDLKKLAKNPIGFYFQKKLGIYLKESEEIKTDENFILPPLDRAVLRNSGWRRPVDTVVQGVLRDGKMPLGPFKHVSIQKLSEEMEQIASSMKKFSVSSDSLFEVVLSDLCEIPKQEGNRRQFPPLSITVEESEVQLIGKLGEGCSEGLIIYKEGKNKEDLAECWPLFLTWCYLIESYQLDFKKDLLFIKGGVRFEGFFKESAPLLAGYLQYYFSAKENMSPLIPQWAMEFTEESSEKLKKVIDQSINEENFYNEEVKWMCREGNTLQVEDLHSCWSSTAQDLFSELFRHRPGGMK